MEIEIDESSEEDDAPSKKDDGFQWKWIEEVWPRDSRPSILRDKATVNNMSVQDLNLMHDMFIKQQKQETCKLQLLKRDELPPRKKFSEGKDDGQTRLHPARWLRLPFSGPEKWYNQVPIRHENVYRNLSLEFGGCSSSVADRTIQLMHDRRNLVELKHFMAENSSVATKPMKEIRRKEDEELITLSDYNWSEPQSVRQVKQICKFLMSVFPFEIVLEILNVKM